MPTFTAVAGVSKTYIVDSGGTERDISDVVENLTLPKSKETAETTTHNDTAKKRIGTLLDSSVSLSGPRDATAEGYFDGLVTGSIQGTRIRYFPEGSSSGKAYQDGTAVWTSLDTTGDVSDANRYSFEGEGNGAFTRRTV